jgi:hypothetical protein
MKKEKEENGFSIMRNLKAKKSAVGISICLKFYHFKEANGD